MQELKMPPIDLGDLGADPQFLQQFYVGDSYAAIEAAMDNDVPQGAEVFRRIKVGRNSTCPCGSGKKFKRCCIHKAKRV